MGNSHLAERLPRTSNWRAVVGTVADGGDAAEVAAATLGASLRALRLAADDPALVHAISLLMQLPLAARSEDFVDGLRSAGMDVGAEPSLFDITAAYTEAIDRAQLHAEGKTDLGEMARLAAVSTINDLVGARTQSLFGTTPEDVRSAFHDFGTTAKMGGLLREFFARFTPRYLGNFLSREMSDFVGGAAPDAPARFSSLAEHQEFNRALERHCREASGIVERFAGEWFSKTKYETGGLPRDRVAGFVGYAFKKLRTEFERRGGA